MVGAGLEAVAGGVARWWGAKAGTFLFGGQFCALARVAAVKPYFVDLRGRQWAGNRSCYRLVAARFAVRDRGDRAPELNYANTQIRCCGGQLRRRGALPRANLVSPGRPRPHRLVLPVGRPSARSWRCTDVGAAVRFFFLSRVYFFFRSCRSAPLLTCSPLAVASPPRHPSLVDCRMKFNISYPATGCQKVIDIDDDHRAAAYYDCRMSQVCLRSLPGVCSACSWTRRERGWVMSRRT